MFSDTVLHHLNNLILSLASFSYLRGECLSFRLSSWQYTNYNVQVMLLLFSLASDLFALGNFIKALLVSRSATFCSMYLYHIMPLSISQNHSLQRENILYMLVAQNFILVLITFGVLFRDIDIGFTPFITDTVSWRDMIIHKIYSPFWGQILDLLF